MIMNEKKGTNMIWVAESDAPDNGGENIHPIVIKPHDTDKGRFVEVIQWFKNGDHPNDGTETFEEGEFKGELLEGNVVRYYRTPECDGEDVCEKCGNTMHYHGWMDNLDGGTVVCPGDHVGTRSDGEYYIVNININPNPAEPGFLGDCDEIRSYILQRYGRKDSAIGYNRLYIRKAKVRVLLVVLEANMVN